MMFVEPILNGRFGDVESRWQPAAILAAVPCAGAFGPKLSGTSGRSQSSSKARRSYTLAVVRADCFNVQFVCPDSSSRDYRQRTFYGLHRSRLPSMTLPARCYGAIW